MLDWQQTEDDTVRFSIQGLMFVMLLVALTAGIFLNRQTALESSELDKRLRSELDTAQLDMLKLPEDERQVHLDRNEITPQWSIDQHKRITQHLGAAFDREVAKIRLTPKDDQVSIISIPVIDRNSTHRQWRANIPKGGDQAPVWLVVQFSDTDLPPAYQGPPAAKVQLSPGENTIDVRLTERTGKLLVNINDQLLVDREQTIGGSVNRTRQYRANNITLDFQATTQQDFAPAHSFPDLCSSKSSSLFGFRVYIERGEAN